MCSGWIKSYRSIVEWEWWDDHNTTRLWIYLLHTVNHEQKKWRGITIEPGQVVTSRLSLSEATGLSQQQIRTSLDKLKSTSNITIKTTNKYTLLTVVKWCDYQEQSTSTSTSNPPNEQPTNNQQITTTKEVKEIKNVRSNKKSLKDIAHSREELKGFDDFWKAYPKKKSKADAQKAWGKINPDDTLITKILEGVDNAKKYDHRFKGEEQYIPYPSKWLRAKGWEDEFSKSSAKYSDEEEKRSMYSEIYDKY